VVAFGTARNIDDPDRKVHALRTISEHLIAGRWEHVRGPNEQELKATAVLEFSIDEASAKIRTGPPVDEEEDYNLQVWAGIVPLNLEAQTPIPDPRLAKGAELPRHIFSVAGCRQNGDPK